LLTTIYSRNIAIKFLKTFKKRQMIEEDSRRNLKEESESQAKKSNRVF
jgi:hypothetical protein